MPNQLYPAALYNRSTSYVSVEDGATKGATLDVNLYDSNGNIVTTSFVDAAAAIAAHVAHADPHPQYLTAAEAAALYVQKTGDTMTGDLTLSAGGTNLGTVRFGNTGARYLHYDGTNYIMAGADLYVNGWKAWTSGTFDPTLKANLASPTFTGTVTTPALVVNNHAHAGTLSVGTTASVSFGAKATIHSASGTQVFFNVFQAGVGSGGFGFLASSSNMKIVNTYSTGFLADGSGLEIDPNGYTGFGGAPGASNFYRLKVYGGILSDGTNSQVAVTDRTTSAMYTWYATGGSMHLYNGATNVFSMTLAGELSGVGISTGASNNTVVKRTAAGYIYANYFNTSANDIGGTLPSHLAVQTGSDSFIRWMTPANFFAGYNVAGLTNTNFTGSTTAVSLNIGGMGTMTADSPYLRIAPPLRHGSTTRNQKLTADGTAWVDAPRVFVQAADPGAKAADNDLWFW